jgi:hypothetical protein
MPNDHCVLCAKLEDKAVRSLIRHFKLVGASDVAELRNDKRKLAELRPVVEEARIERDGTTEAYRQHIRSHGTAASA